MVEVCNYRDSHVCIRASEGKIWTESLRCFHLWQNRRARDSSHVPVCLPHNVKVGWTQDNGEVAVSLLGCRSRPALWQITDFPSKWSVCVFSGLLKGDPPSRWSRQRWAVNAADDTTLPRLLMVVSKEGSFRHHSGLPACSPSCSSPVAAIATYHRLSNVT